MPIPKRENVGAFSGNLMEINVQDFQNGIYFLRWTMDGKSGATKFVVRR